MQPDQKDERRKHPRIAVETKGRFLAPDGSEHQCSLRDISIGGIAVSSPVSLFEGAQIIIYLDDFGRFEGKIVRVFEGGFAIETAISGPRRERLQQRLDALARGETIDVSAR
ncbi:MAG: pilus assembly protein PilZ, partial [Alphaproteobacteria bacterium HGW-Alphaproteobacteria-12]